MSISSITSAIQEAASKSEGASKKFSKDLDSFLLILTTQLQNQDPLSPMDSTEFTNQLVQFANVQQSINQTKRLEDLVGLQKATELNSAVNYMGKAVKVDHNEFTHKAGDSEELEYTLPETAETATLFVFNSAGELAYSSIVRPTEGTHTITWDAKDSLGNPMPAGNYHFEVRATKAEAGEGEEEEIKGIKYAYSAIVDSVEFGEKSVTLKMGNISVDLGKVTSVQDPPKRSHPSDLTSKAEPEEKTDEKSSDEGKESSDDGS